MSTIDVHEKKIEYYGHTLRVLAVSIDGQLISNSFQLFDASTTLIASQICEECYAASSGSIATCGYSDITVRKHGDTIYWFFANHEYFTPQIPNVSVNQVWSFPLANYETQLAGSTDRLPEFTPTDIQMILRRGTIYPAELGLFTIPDLTDDPQGRRLLDAIAQSITSSNFQICPEPERFRTIRIGIEADGIPETVVEIGIHKSRCVIRFVANPSFPLWLASDAIHRNAASFAT